MLEIIYVNQVLLTPIYYSTLHESKLDKPMLHIRSDQFQGFNLVLYNIFVLCDKRAERLCFNVSVRITIEAAGYG